MIYVKEFKEKSCYDCKLRRYKFQMFTHVLLRQGQMEKKVSQSDRAFDTSKLIFGVRSWRRGANTRTCANPQHVLFMPPSLAIFFVSHVGVTVNDDQSASKMFLRYCSYARLWQLVAVSAIVTFCNNFLRIITHCLRRRREQSFQEPVSILFSGQRRWPFE